MREILFRGKCVDTGKWYEGQYIQLHKTTFCFAVSEQRERENEIHQIVFERMTDWSLPNQHLRVDVLPETVGQYTGLTDKNGKRIFEGDICQTKGFPLIDDKPFVVEWNDDECSFYWRDALGTDEFNIGVSQNTTIIGNIHDNPELLKGE